MATTKNPIHVIGNKHPVAFWKRLSILKKSVDHFCYSYGFILLHESNFSSKVKFLHLDTYKLKLFFISATGVSSAILAKSITYSNLLAGDPKVSRQGFFCSNLSYQNQFNLTKTRRVV
jgi:hypothetical protein